MKESTLSAAGGLIRVGQKELSRLRATETKEQKRKARQRPLQGVEGLNRRGGKEGPVLQRLPRKKEKKKEEY